MDRSLWVALAAAAALALALRPPVPTYADAAGERTQGLALQASLAEQRIQVLEDGRVIRTYRLPSDELDHATPLGTFQIRSVEWRPYWVAGDAPRRRRPTASSLSGRPTGRIRISFGQPGLYLHSVADDGSAALIVGHACLTLRQHDMVDLARLLLDRTDEPRSPNWLRRVVHGATGNAQQRLTSPVPLTIAP